MLNYRSTNNSEQLSKLLADLYPSTILIIQLITHRPTTQLYIYLMVLSVHCLKIAILEPKRRPF